MFLFIIIIGCVWGLITKSTHIKGCVVENLATTTVTESFESTKSEQIDFYYEMPKESIKG